jgi:hypothetical protein
VTAPETIIAGSGLEQNQSKRAIDESIEGGFYFHPIEEKSLDGDPGNHPSSKDRSMGTPERKKSLEGCAIGYSYSDFAMARRPLRRGERLLFACTGFLAGPHAAVRHGASNDTVLRPGRGTLCGWRSKIAGFHSDSIECPAWVKELICRSSD